MANDKQRRPLGARGAAGACSERKRLANREKREKEKQQKRLGIAPSPPAAKKYKRVHKSMHVRRAVMKIRRVPRVRDETWEGEEALRQFQAHQEPEERDWEVGGEDGWRAGRGHSEELESEFEDEQYWTEEDVEIVEEYWVTDDEEEDEMMDGKGWKGKKRKRDEDDKDGEDEEGAARFFSAPLAFRPAAAC